MRLISISVLLFLVSWAFSADAQKYKVPDEDFQLATRLKATYEKARVVGLSSSTIIEFKMLRGSKTRESIAPIVAEETQEVSLISLRDNYYYRDVIFFDNESEVIDLKAFDRKGKNKDVITSEDSYEDGGIFHTDSKIFNFSVYYDKFGEKGSYNWLKKTYDIKYFTSAYFHDHFPALKRTIEFRIPDWLELELIEMNFDDYEIEKEESQDDEMKIIRYIVSDLESTKTERNAPGPSYVKPHLVIVPKSYRYGSSTKKPIMQSVDDLYDWYKSLRSQINNEPGTISELVKTITEDKETDIDKIEGMYYWVQDNIRYVAFEDGIAGFKPEACQNVYKNKYGDCKGMANLLTEMLINAGYDSRLTWLGTRRIAYDYSIPSIAVDNHMIATLFYDDKVYFLDPTEKFVALGENAYRIQGQQVLIEDGESYLIKDIPEEPYEANEVSYKFDFEMDGAKLVGSGQNNYNGETKTSILYIYNNTRTDHRQEAMENFLSLDDKDIIVENITSTDLTNRRIPISIDYSISLDNQVLEVGDEVYVQLDFRQEMKNFDFDDDRVNDYLMSSKYYRNMDISLKIPEGYDVSYLPEPINHEREDWILSSSYEKNGSIIQYSKKLIIKNGIIRENDFKEWNDDIDKLTEYYEDRIILTKTQ